MPVRKRICDEQGRGARSVAQPENLTDPFDLVGMRKTPGAFLANMFETLGQPDWLLQGTSLAIMGRFPEKITVRDYLTMIGNLKTGLDGYPYFLDYAVSGVPLYYGALDLGIRYAPDIVSALELIVRFADDRPGYHRNKLTREEGNTVLELVPATNLGAGRSILIETTLLYYYQSASRILARPAKEVIVDMAHGVPPYADRLMAAMQCTVRWNAGRDAIGFPDAISNQPSVTYDPELWRIAEVRCAEEKKARVDHEALSRVRSIVVRGLLEDGRVPRLNQMAETLGMSSRTLIRHLKKEGYSYQALVDEVLQHQSKALLADSKLPIARIAEELGFPDDSGFHRSFRRWFGMTPAQYRREALSM